MERKKKISYILAFNGSSLTLWTLLGLRRDNANEDEDASSSGDDEMTTSEWLTLCHSWQKGEIVLGMRVVMYLGGELV